jgi:hypothetical protein
MLEMALGEYEEICSQAADAGNMQAGSRCR